MAFIAEHWWLWLLLIIVLSVAAYFSYTKLLKLPEGVFTVLMVFLLFGLSFSTVLFMLSLIIPKIFEY